MIYIFITQFDQSDFWRFSKLQGKSALVLKVYSMKGRAKDMSQGNPQIARVLAINLIRHRKMRGWTQGELADIAELSKGAVTQIELLKRWPALPTISKIAQALDIDETELFIPPNYVKAEAMDKAQILDLIGDLEHITGDLSGISGQLRKAFGLPPKTEATEQLPKTIGKTTAPDEDEI